VWPASSSSALAGRRGSRRTRATNHPSAARTPTTESAATGQLPAGVLHGASGRAGPLGQRPKVVASANRIPVQPQKARRLR